MIPTTLKRLALALTLLGLQPDTRAAESYPPTQFPDSSTWGRQIQRTMRLLATSTPEKRHTVRILFYGQSITEQQWAKRVEDDLRQRFPHANLVVENRALGGFASQMLVKMAETDLYPFQPDLLIFHVYGAHDKYEDIIRRTRERTTAEILRQNDHVTKPSDFAEETDPAKRPPAGKHWDAFMNHNHLPSLAKKRLERDLRSQPSRASSRCRRSSSCSGRPSRASWMNSHLRSGMSRPSNPL
jgi:hypothetical protein